MNRNPKITRALARMALAFVIAVAATPANAQWVQEYEQFYLPASHNWVFRDNYAGADRLFNAFDYGHAILYEELYTAPYGPVERLEVDRYEFLTERLLRRPPRLPLEERAIAISYAKLVPEAKQMFEWAHLAHRQIYDVLADERLSMEQKDAAIAELLAYYRSRPDLAFSSVPKSMDIMDGQHFSLAFRGRYPKFNGLIWAYHWLQVGLYEPLLVNTDASSRAAGVNATVGRFWQMLEEPPGKMPHLMPMTSGVAPTFASRYPEAAIIFDNLHMMHDIISDILTSEGVPRDRKRAEILRAAEMFRDDEAYAISMEEWEMMGEMMGSNNMGGLAAGFLPELPEPTVPYGMSMAGMDHAGIAGTQGGQHGTTDQSGAMDHAAMGHAMPADSIGGSGMMSEEHMRMMHEMHTRMMADPVIRERIATDPVIQRMMAEMDMTMPLGGSAGMVGPAPSETARAMDFIVRLLSDPEVQARIHADPRLHEIWSDPEVQRRIAELPSERPADVQDPSADPHQHP